MNQANGNAPVPVLSGHLVLYPDAVAFRPEGGADEDVIVRPIIPMARDQLIELFSPGDGGLLATVMNGQIPKMSKGFIRAARAQGVPGV